MKKIILLFVAVLAFSCSKDDSNPTVAKQLSITKLNGTEINDGDVLTITSSDEADALVAFYVKNNTSTAFNVRAKCVSISTVTSNPMQFCFGIQCYGDVEAGTVYPTDSHELVTVPANDKVGGAAFHFQYLPTTSESVDYVFEFYQYDSNNVAVGNKVRMTYRYSPN